METRPSSGMTKLMPTNPRSCASIDASARFQIRAASARRPAPARSRAAPGRCSGFRPGRRARPAPCRSAPGGGVRPRPVRTSSTVDGDLVTQAAVEQLLTEMREGVTVAALKIVVPTQGCGDLRGMGKRRRFHQLQILLVLLGGARGDLIDPLAGVIFQASKRSKVAKN